MSLTHRFPCASSVKPRAHRKAETSRRPPHYSGRLTIHGRMIEHHDARAAAVIYIVVAVEHAQAVANRVITNAVGLANDIQRTLGSAILVGSEHSALTKHEIRGGTADSKSQYAVVAVVRNPDLLRWRIDVYCRRVPRVESAAV